jgi:hypothetical protein
MAVRALLDDVFGGMSGQDWEHALGGVHAQVWEGAELIGHASVIQRRRVNTDHHCRHQLLLHHPGGRTVAGMPDSGAAGVAPLLSHTTARPDRLTRRY